MEVVRKKWRKALEKCKSMNEGSRRSSSRKGCFAVYVGAERQRFVVEARQAGHPLFRDLLEDAESEYGHSCSGPLLLPCDVALFCQVLAQITHNLHSAHSDDDDIPTPGGCASISLCSPRPKGYALLASPKSIFNLTSGSDY